MKGGDFMSYIKRLIEDIDVEHDNNLCKGYSVRESINEISSRRRMKRKNVVEALEIMGADTDESY